MTLLIRIFCLFVMVLCTASVAMAAALPMRLVLAFMATACAYMAMELED